jgi:hypothetical protein
VEADVIRLKIAGFVAAVMTAVPFPARAQDIRGIVVDQTGLPCPGRRCNCATARPSSRPPRPAVTARSRLPDAQVVTLEFPDPSDA